MFPATIGGMAWTERDYQRLGDFIVSARVEMGLDRAQLANAADITLRTLADIETGQLRSRKSFSAESLATISKVLGWAPGTWRRVLDDPEAAVTHQQMSLPGVDAVGPSPQDEDSLLYRRPDGLSDAAWEKLKNETREYLEWMIDRASRER